MFETGKELEDNESEPDSVEKDADRDERWMDFAYVLVPMMVFVAVGFRYHWASYIALAYGYSGYLYVHVITRPQYSAHLDDVRGKMWEFLPVHLCFLLIVGLGQYEWYRYKPLMPEWLIHEGRKGSFYLWLGAIASFCVGLGENRVLRRRLDAAFESSEPPAS